MIEGWLVSIRDCPARPPPMQRHVLHCLALRMNWATGRGFASTGQLAADADAEERTVRRATVWARDQGFLLRTRRGGRLGNGQVAASEWQLTIPGHKPQPVTGDLLRSQPDSGASQPDNGAVSTGQNTGLNWTAAHHHQESSTSRTSSSRAQRPREADGAADDLISMIIEEIEGTTGYRIGPLWAAKVARTLLDGREINRSTAGYVRSAIRREANPRTRFLSHYDDQDRL